MRISKNPATIRILSRFPKLDFSVFEPGRNGARVFVQGTDIDPTVPHCQFLLRGSDCVRRLLSEAKATLKNLPDGVLLETGGVKLKLQSWEELFIATEVFAEGIYNLQIDSSFVLIDVGMNVATTSLFFARMPGCQAIYAFELFPKTAAKARVNLSLNPTLAQKVEATTKGVAAKTGEAELDYMEEYKGSHGIHGLPKYVIPEADLRYERVQVEFVSCVDVFREVLGRHPKTDIICKLDCEGAEYEILEALAPTGMLSRIRFFMIEWHEKGAAPIEKLLARNGFSLLSLSPNSPNHSMLYAWREPGAVHPGEP
jgi:FkbM family methyltransferase